MSRLGDRREGCRAYIVRLPVYCSRAVTGVLSGLECIKHGAWRRQSNRLKNPTSRVKAIVWQLSVIKLIRGQGWVHDTHAPLEKAEGCRQGSRRYSLKGRPQPVPQVRLADETSRCQGM